MTRAERLNALLNLIGERTMDALDARRWGRVQILDERFRIVEDAYLAARR